MLCTNASHTHTYTHNLHSHINPQTPVQPSLSPSLPASAPSLPPLPASAPFIPPFLLLSLSNESLALQVSCGRRRWLVVCFHVCLGVRDYVWYRTHAHGLAQASVHLRLTRCSMLLIRDENLNADELRSFYEKASNEVCTVLLLELWCRYTFNSPQLFQERV